MDQYNYLIIGGGMTADSAVQGIREIDLSGRVGIISQEEYPPYNRPPLTKGLWYGTNVEEIWRKTEQARVTMHLGKKVVSIDPQTRVVKDSAGGEYQYEKLLLATGGIPRKLGCQDEGVLYYRTLKDYYELRNWYDKGEEFAMIGAGYIGTELAAALAMNGKKVTLIFPDRLIQEKKFPKPFASFLNGLFTEKEVQLVPNQKVTSVIKEKEKYRVTTTGSTEYLVDGVIAGLGIDPNVELAKNCGIVCDNGITVDQHLQTSQAHIWSAGDVANFYSPALEKHLRIEHEDAANSMGKCAGRNMAGARESYTYLPFFYSDLFEIGYEAIGELSSDMETQENWEDPNWQGSIYYLKDGRVKGALFVNTWNQIDKARELIQSGAYAGDIVT